MIKIAADETEGAHGGVQFGILGAWRLS
jgi:hypothetical protein